MKVIATNKKANFEYFISQKYEAGIVLVGSEVKSIRDGGISIAESFVTIDNGEIFLKNAYIKPYEKANNFCPDTKRNRKLLLHKREIEKLQKEKSLKSMTLIPLRVYLDKGYVKVEIALAKGKKLYDKRQVKANEVARREVERSIKENLRGR